jgi:uncharacterized FlaG/YvyC family protein
MNVSSISPGFTPVKASTQASASPQTASERRTLASAARVVNDSQVLGEQNELTFAIDPSSHRLVARIVDRNTQQVVQQLPSEYILRVAQELSGKALSTSQ